MATKKTKQPINLDTFNAYYPYSSGKSLILKKMYDPNLP